MRFFRFIVPLALAMNATADGVWLDVPFVAQLKNGCGAAVVSMICRYWRVQGAVRIPDPNPAEILNQLYEPEARGIYGKVMQRYLEDAGFQVFILRSDWTDLSTHLAKGRPLIAALGPGNRGALHYVVVAGVDAAQNQVLLNDPAGRKLRKIDRKDFEKQWSVTGNWTLLAVPRQDP